MVWDTRFGELARTVAGWSKDPSTKVGAVIVDKDNNVRALGFNGFPRGIADDGRLQNRDQKYPIICHAEENALAAAARIGVPLAGCAIHVWPFAPCSRCARLIIQAGIVEVIAHGRAGERWQEDCDRATALMGEAGVLVTVL